MLKAYSVNIMLTFLFLNCSPSILVCNLVNTLTVKYCVLHEKEEMRVASDTKAWLIE